MKPRCAQCVAHNLYLSTAHSIRKRVMIQQVTVCGVFIVNQFSRNVVCKCNLLRQAKYVYSFASATFSI